jgi:hypothetical protein
LEISTFESMLLFTSSSYDKRNLNVVLKFCSTHSQKTISSKRFRTFLQHVVVELYEKLFPFSNRTLLLQEYVSITRALAVNEDDERLANLLASLVKPADGVEKEVNILFDGCMNMK